MERKIGEIFTYGDKRYQVVKVDFGIGCVGCAFKTSGCSKYKSLLGHCSYIFRHDKTGVIFKLINNNMEIKNNQLTIDIPEGMEIDTENSSLAEGIIKFKSKCITYSKIINSFNSITNTNVYIHSSDTKALKAIAQLMNITMEIGSQTGVIQVNINILLCITIIPIQQIIIGTLFIIKSILKIKKMLKQ